MKSPVDLMCAVLTDVKRMHPEVSGIDRDIRTIEHRSRHEGFSFLSKTLPDFCDSIFHGIEVGQLPTITSFSRMKNGCLPKFLSGFTCKVFDQFTGKLLENVDPGILMSIRQILLLYKKSLASDMDEETLSRKAIETFFKTESDVKYKKFDQRSSLDFVSSIILNSIGIYDPIDYRKHGPGAVREGLDANEKWLALYDSRFSCYLEDEFQQSICTSDDSFTDELVPDGAQLSLFPDNTPSESVRLVSVPKNSRSMRCISVEPVVKQYVQQGLNGVLRQAIKDCPILSSCITLNDQTRNQDLARVGSSTLAYSTLDLSSASDLLSLNVVERVFARHRSFYDLLVQSRTPLVHDGKNFHHVWKYAGMGNATTFPVQSVCFAVICIASIIDAEGIKPTYRNVERIARSIRVFGDDIITRHENVLQVVRGLESFGLKINRSKSFLNGYFKESCGFDGYKGVDITPIYCRYRPSSTSSTPSEISSWVSTSNQLFMCGYYSASDFLKTMVEAHTGPLPIVSRESSGLGWHTRSNASTRQKFCTKLHKWLVFTLKEQSSKVKSVLDGHAALHKFFMTPSSVFWRTVTCLDVRPDDHLAAVPRRRSQRLRWRWVPA